jgi:hypothetical protein
MGICKLDGIPIGGIGAIRMGPAGANGTGVRHAFEFLDEVI